MMDEEEQEYKESFQANFNDKWNDNIYENLKNLEELERITREGCRTLLEFVQIPISLQPIVIPEAQYKGLCLMVTEFSLLMTDITPLLEVQDWEGFINSLKEIEKVITTRKLFITDIFSASDNNIIRKKVTPNFYEVLDILTMMRRKIIRKIAPMLYVQDQKNVTW